MYTENTQYIQLQNIWICKILQRIFDTFIWKDFYKNFGWLVWGYFYSDALSEWHLKVHNLSALYAIFKPLIIHWDYIFFFKLLGNSKCHPSNIYVYIYIFHKLTDSFFWKSSLIRILNPYIRVSHFSWNSYVPRDKNIPSFGVQTQVMFSIKATAASLFLNKKFSVLSAISPGVN